jgi:hypothetical protein
MKRSNADSTAGNNPQNRRQFLYAAGCAVALPAALPAAQSARATNGDTYTQSFSLDGSDWLLSIDPGNNGGSRGWTQGPPADATATRVPWVIQDAFPDYHGVARYWATVSSSGFYRSRWALSYSLSRRGLSRRGLG